ncbi:MAG: helix-turn-helix domain-containing protein [Bdellovibrionales bacterium]|nr:helix-turn-helix domain-containing protein [Bdellovibrionales bacterium]
MQPQTVKSPPGLNDESTEDKVSPSKWLFENRIWNIRDTAHYTGYAVGTLYNLVSKNLIPHRKKRGRLFFIPFEIQNWIEEGDLE